MAGQALTMPQPHCLSWGAVQRGQSRSWGRSSGEGLGSGKWWPVPAASLWDVVISVAHTSFGNHCPPLRAGRVQPP